jgi:hypothetical protein
MTKINKLKMWLPREGVLNYHHDVMITKRILRIVRNERIWMSWRRRTQRGRRHSHVVLVEDIVKRVSPTSEVRLVGGPEGFEATIPELFLCPGSGLNGIKNDLLDA